MSEDNTDDTLAEVPPVVAGGVYERTLPNGSLEQTCCLSTIEKEGTRWGLFRRVGYADERFQEGSGDLAGWTLIWGPGVKTSARTGKPTRKYDKQADATK